jgi:hydroxyacylglutathione hydrolase
LVLDVRNRSEWDKGHIPGARHVPLAELPDRLDELRTSLHGATKLLVHCQGGSRSAVAASLLAAEGFPGVTNLEGGFGAWQRARHALSAEPSVEPSTAP